MRRLRYNVAVSLDGFIVGPNGESDWILMDPTIDFKALFDEFDTLLMGRKTFEEWMKLGTGGLETGKKIIVVSRTLLKGEYPGTQYAIIRDDVVRQVEALKAESGKDIWLFGGGELFRQLLDARLVDTVELAVIPIFLSRGVPVLAPGLRSGLLHLAESKILKSGIAMLTYHTTPAS